MLWVFAQRGVPSPKMVDASPGLGQGHQSSGRAQAMCRAQPDSGRTQLRIGGADPETDRAHPKLVEPSLDAVDQATTLVEDDLDCVRPSVAVSLTLGVPPESRRSHRQARGRWQKIGRNAASRCASLHLCSAAPKPSSFGGSVASFGPLCFQTPDAAPMCSNPARIRSKPAPSLSKPPDLVNPSSTLARSALDAMDSRRKHAQFQPKIGRTRWRVTPHVTFQAHAHTPCSRFACEWVHS